MIYGEKRKAFRVKQEIDTMNGQLYHGLKFEGYLREIQLCKATLLGRGRLVFMISDSC